MDNLRLVGGPINVTNNERLIFLPTIGVFQVIRTIVVQIGMDIVRNRGRNNTIVEEAVDVEDIIIEDRLNSTTDSVNKDINIVYWVFIEDNPVSEVKMDFLSQIIIILEMTRKGLKAVWVVKMKD